jgi:hypothetical protein
MVQHRAGSLASVGAHTVPSTTTKYQEHPLKSWVKDPETGFLTPGPNYRGPKYNIFDLNRKKEFVTIAKELYPNISAICQAVGISTGTFDNHYILDEGFRTAIEAVKRAAIDTVEGTMFQFAKRPGCFMDRIAIMRAYRGELYNPKQTIVHEKAFTPEQAVARKVQLATVVDAELVEVNDKILEGEAIEESTGPGSSAELPAAGTPVVEVSRGGDAQSEPRPRDPLSELGDI